MKLQKIVWVISTLPLWEKEKQKTNILNKTKYTQMEGLHCFMVEFCLTEACVRTAADLLSSVDRTVDPCEDFYEYACGSWVRANPIPDGKSMWGTFIKLDQQNQLVVKNALCKSEYLKRLMC